VLNRATVLYGSATELRATLDYDFSEEKKFSYKNLSMDESIHHLAVFVSRLWQIHVFGEGNTRTTAVFFIKYLRTLDFDITNNIFAENAWYFRNSLLRANYNDLKNGIHETTEFLEVFLRNLLLSENYPLHNRILYISGTFKEPEKANIDSKKANIGEEKVNIEEDFTAKTASHVQKLQEALGSEAAFGRSDVQRVLGLKPTRSSALLREMAEHGIIEPVSGHGKGKYHFR
ncbi:MAG: Fic family protein, partial [Lachnospiraceae bacterium]|nr:Fic family protein [Lachnospiraceae bacterium]